MYMFLRSVVVILVLAIISGIPYRRSWLWLAIYYSGHIGVTISLIVIWIDQVIADQGGWFIAMAGSVVLAGFWWTGLYAAEKFADAVDHWLVGRKGKNETGTELVV